MAKTIILSVVSAGARNERFFAFQLQQEDRKHTASINKLFITIDNQTFEITNSLKAYKNQGRISHPEIHLWITQNLLHRTPPRNPAKLIFSFSIVRKRQVLKLYPYQANLINV